MVEIGVPVWNARNTLPALLDTMVAQTKKTFIVCLSIDGDGIDYSDIIETYKARGLKIRVINSAENGGAGIARQRVIDSTQCEYLMFADADDLLMPRAVEILHRSIACGGYDILRSHFIRESPQQDLLLRAKDATITWFHGKIYRTTYLRQLGVRMLPELKTDEDAYYNLIAWYGTEKRGYVDETTYIWRENPNSLTRADKPKDYFIKNYHYYIKSQALALRFIFDHNIPLDEQVITFTLINLYYYYMHARFYYLDMNYTDSLFEPLRLQPRMLEWFNKEKNWLDIIASLKTGDKYEDGTIVFFTEPFNVWLTKIVKGV